MSRTRSSVEDGLDVQHRHGLAFEVAWHELHSFDLLLDSRNEVLRDARRIRHLVFKHLAVLVYAYLLPERDSVLVMGRGTRVPDEFVEPLERGVEQPLPLSVDAIVRHREDQRTLVGNIDSHHP
jgi:hypothetical protein